jgi:hypothetical protein
MKVPTDLEMLGAIYDMYYEEYAGFVRENPSRKTKIFVPISCEKIGEKLGIDKDIVFLGVFITTWKINTATSVTMQ